jgi:hypothetical protein
VREQNIHTECVANTVSRILKIRYVKYLSSITA